MRARLLVGLGSLLALTAFAPAPKPKPERRHDGAMMTRISGRWVLVGLQRGVGGVAKPGYHLEVEIKDGRYTYFRGKEGAGERLSSMTSEIALDPNRKPCWFDLKRPKAELSTEGVCAVEGDTLRICYTNTKGQRPATMTPAKSNEMLMVFERKKAP